MNKLVAPFAAIAFVFSIAIAQADATAGKIATVDPAAGSITLENGTTFTIAEGVSMEGLEPGTEVTVSFEEQDGQLIATEVAPSN
jgi:Cu/Ag efflux protein CusF